MKTKLTLLTLLIITAIGTNAQNLIAVQHAGTPAFYTDLQTAITNTLAGDTVYIPGGSFGPVSISKKLYLVGVGHSPDSTNVTGRTMIQQLTLATGADGGSITGILITGSTFYGGINNYSISRCNIFSLTPDGTIGSNNITNFSFSEDIIGHILLFGSNHSFFNNIFVADFVINNSIVKNNIFLLTFNNFTYPGSFTNSIVENSIFQSGTPNTGNSCIFNNNVNNGVNGFNGSNQGNNNDLSGITLQTIFTNYNSTVDIYKNDFSLPVGSPYKNAGRDGTDIGIYGGAFPWKPGSIPFNPHFQSLNVAPKTDSSGNLKVQITVAAQNN